GISHLHICSKGTLIVQCFGLTQNPFNGNYMLVIDYKDMNNSSKGSSNWNNSRVYSFKNLPEPRNATKAYHHSIQFDFDLQDGLIIDEKDLTVNPNKKVNSNNNEGSYY
ncbi:hypothetical protein RhiirA1_488582, partial [Rhizophagus irregularis]